MPEGACARGKQIPQTIFHGALGKINLAATASPKTLTNQELIFRRRQKIDGARQGKSPTHALKTLGFETA
jgi:hypothetical protein